MIVDIHAHYFPKEYNDTLLRIGGRSLPEAARPTTARPMRNDDASGIATRLEQMAEAEVQMQILSPAASPPYAEKEADAVAAARLINDAYAELARKYPGRFNAVVSLPLPHIDASLEDAAIVLHLIARRVPERFPNIKYVVPHLGGIIPMLLQRLDNQAPRQHPNLPERPSVTARRFYYDIVGHGSQAALLCAWKAFGADHLVAGSDYPVLLAFETYRQNFFYLRESSLPAADVDKILHHNAQIVLGLKH